jgi:hypothetical protein
MRFRALPIVAALASAAALPLSPLSVRAADEDNIQLNDQQVALIRSTCLDIMRLRMVTDRAQCIESLSNTMKSRIFAMLTQKSVMDCTESGYVIGTSKFSFCMLSKRAGYGSAMTSTRGAASGGPGLAGQEAAGDPVSVTAPRDLAGTPLHQREEYACAEIGVDPGEPGFQSCLQDLDLALYLARHPPSGLWNPFG